MSLHFQACRKKKHLVSIFHYALPPLCSTKILEPLQMNEHTSLPKTSLRRNIIKKNKKIKEMGMGNDSLFHDS
jgi:hypothetical protein